MKKLNVLAGIGCAVLMSYGTTVYAKSDNKPADTGSGNTTTTTTTSLPVVPLNWTAGTATVDGNTSDWNLATDASTIMCEAGKISASGACDGKDHLSTLYTRYDCNTNTMYVLVLKEAGHTADNGESWVKIYDLGSSSVNFSAFSEVSSGGAVQGYEASFALAAGTYNDVQVHITIDGGKTSSTGKIVATRSIIVPEDCTVPVVEEPKTCADAEYAEANQIECRCEDAEYKAENPDICTDTYGDSKASVVGIWKYVGSMSVQDFDATYKEGTDYVFTGDDSGEYLLQGIDDKGNTTSMSGAKMK